MKKVVPIKYPRYLGVRLTPKQERAVVVAANRWNVSCSDVIRGLIDENLGKWEASK